MERTKIRFAFISSLALLFFFFLASNVWAQIDVGNFSISGEAEVGGLPRHTRENSKDAKFQEYRDIPESVIVPQLQLMIGGRKEDFYLNFDSSKVGLHDQNYLLRFGRYGLLDVEFEWDQIPHLFSRNTARTPYAMHDGIYTLSTKPAAGSPGGTQFQTWVNSDANAVDLKLFNGIGRFKLRYTPTPGWTFTGSYWSNNNSGKRAFGAYIGSSPGNFNITELVEPIDYQTHNIELGGEYAGDGWSLGLKYNASLFHNNVSTLVWDTPFNRSGVGSACTDSARYSSSPASATSPGIDDGTGLNRGPCRGRIDLYPSNQAHTLTLTGTKSLLFKTFFMGTASYGVRIQNDAFLPYTINSAITQPVLTRESLDGDVRPTMVNLTLVNRYVDRLDLKAHYRYYDLDNRSKKVFFPDGLVINDQAGNTVVPTCNPTCPEAGLRSFPYAYSKQNIGLDAGYDFTRWLTGKLGYGWERMHRERREVLNADEHSLGPTFDIKPNYWVLLRASYKRFWRNAHNYDPGREVVIETTETPEDIRGLNIRRKFEEAARDRDKSSLFTQVAPWDRLTLYAGFEFMNDRFPRTELGLKDDINYSPSIGLIYMPLDWVKLFTDYNWERFDWHMKAVRGNATTSPQTNPNNVWHSRGKDEINTVSIGSDMDLIQKILGLRLQYGFSVGRSKVFASGDTTPATNYPIIWNKWHEVLARLEYRVHKNVGLRFGYYFNAANEKDVGVDIMKPWMGDVDTASGGVQRSIFLGDRIKGPFTAHVGFMALRLSF